MSKLSQLPPFKASAIMHCLYLAWLLALVRASLTTQASKSVNHHVPYMIGGREQRVRSAVMILFKREHQTEEKYEYECAGTIVSDKHILTAATCLHCVDNNDCDQNVAIDDMMVAAGEDDMAKLYDDDMELITSGDASLHEVKRIITHPDYIHGAKKWDLALLELKTSLIFNDNIDAARLPPPGMNYTKEWLKTGGWDSGDTETVGMNSRDGIPAQKHRIIETWTKSEDECKELFPDVNYSQDLHLCAKQHNILCKGDKGARVAGAGVMFTQWEHYIVIGVVSATSTTGCSVFFTKTEEVLSWIDMEASIRLDYKLNKKKFYKFFQANT